MGWDLVREAFGTVFANLRHAAAATAVPILSGVIAATVILWIGGVTPQMLMLALFTYRLPGIAVLAFVLAMVVLLLAFTWAAVGWYRFLLRQELPRPVPALHEPEVFRTAGRSLIVSAVVVVLGLVVSSVLGLVLGATGTAGVLGPLAGFAASVLLGVVSLRLGVMMPAAATGRRIDLRSAWEGTEEMVTPILQAVAILLLFDTLVSFTLGLLTLPLALSFGLQLALLWVSMLVWQTVLAELYRRFRGSVGRQR